MANYKIHDHVTLYSALVLAPLCYWAAERYDHWWSGHVPALAPTQTALLVIGAHLFSGLLLSNDLDVYSRIYRRWGPLRFLWYPYQKLVAHRSWLSHNPLAGPLLRLLYLYIIIELILLGAHRLVLAIGSSTAIIDAGLGWTSQVWAWLWAYPQISLPLAVGLVLGSAVHSLVDMA